MTTNLMDLPESISKRERNEDIGEKYNQKFINTTYKNQSGSYNFYSPNNLKSLKPGIDFSDKNLTPEKILQFMRRTKSVNSQNKIQDTSRNINLNSS